MVGVSQETVGYSYFQMIEQVYVTQKNKGDTSVHILNRTETNRMQCTQHKQWQFVI